MRFPQPLTPGRLLRRYKRFLADVHLDGAATPVTVHVPNPGAMLGLADPGMRVWLSRSQSKTRKLPWTLELVEANGAHVGVNTLTPNRLVAEALAAGAIPELAGYAVRPEVKYGEASRVDFLLTAPGRAPHWVEVKNCHLMRTRDLAEFPDCVAARSARHLYELSAQVAVGDDATLVFVVQRTDCTRFAPAADLDPKFAAALAHARSVGVQVLVCGCDVSPEGVTIARRLSVEERQPA